MDREVFENLKASDRVGWEEKIGELEYGRLKARFTQVINGLDLVLGENEVNTAVLSALSISAGYTREYTEKKVSEAVHAILGNHNQFSLKFERERTDVIQCHLGRTLWAKKCHGIGMLVKCDHL